MRTLAGWKKMQKTLLKKGIAIAVITVFIGVSFIPVTLGKVEKRDIIHSDDQTELYEQYWTGELGSFDMNDFIDTTNQVIDALREYEPDFTFYIPRFSKPKLFQSALGKPSFFPSRLFKLLFHGLDDYISLDIDLLTRPCRA